MQDYKSLRVAVTIWATWLTHTRTHRQLATGCTRPNAHSRKKPFSEAWHIQTPDDTRRFNLDSSFLEKKLSFRHQRASLPLQVITMHQQVVFKREQSSYCAIFIVVLGLHTFRKHGSQYRGRYDVHIRPKIWASTSNFKTDATDVKRKLSLIAVRCNPFLSVFQRTWFSLATRLLFNNIVYCWTCM